MRIYIFFFVLLIANVLIHQYDYQFDLTADQKYSLDNRTKELLKLTNRTTEITVFLEGNVPVSFKKFRSFIDQYLKKVKQTHSDIKITYIDPNEGTVEERQDIQGYFRSYGVKPVSRRVSSKDELSQSLLYPYISVANDDRVIFIDLLGDKEVDQSEAEALYVAESNFKNKLDKALRDLSSEASGLIAVMGDNKELIAAGMNMTSGRMGNYYFVPMNPSDVAPLLDTIQAMLISSHKTAIDRSIQLLADQSLMREIPVIWMVDVYDVSLDSIGTYGQYPASPLNLVAADQLFSYGVKVETKLLQDLRSTAIPQVVGTEGGKSKTVLFDYPYHILAQPVDSIGFEQDLVATSFVTSVEPIEGRSDLSFEPLLQTSDKLKFTENLTILDFNSLRVAPVESSFIGPSRDIAILTRGAQQSYFKNRLTNQDRAFLNDFDIDFVTQVGESRLEVIGDVDFAKPFIGSDGSLYPLGYNKWDRKTYPGNVSFLANSLEYLIHGTDYVRTSTIINAARIIDINKWNKNRVSYFSLMLGIPIGLFFIIRLIWSRYRKNKYAA